MRRYRITIEVDTFLNVKTLKEEVAKLKNLNCGDVVYLAMEEIEPITVLVQPKG
jgi:hypothetical protein